MFEKLSNSWELVKASAAVLPGWTRSCSSSRSPRPSCRSWWLPPSPCRRSWLECSRPAFRRRQVSPPLATPPCSFSTWCRTVIFFCNTALVGAALIRLRGGDPTVADGFRIAASRVGPILGYAFIAATVGMVLRAISERSGFLGRLVVSLVGFAWNLATFLAVPVLVVEDVGPIEAVQRSASTSGRPGANRSPAI